MFYSFFNDLINIFYDYSTSDRVVGNILSNDDTLYYNMNHKYRGKAIIFNHENFEVGDLKPRLGTRFDCITLEKSLIKLGFDVIIYADFTVEEMDEKLSYCKCKLCIS